MRAGSLFSGVGGFDLGLERAGMEVVWQVENDPYCNRVLAKHWPHVKRYGDIRELDPATLEPVDLICGGFPCQPVSVAGKRLGRDDERWLWPEFARIVRGVRPRYVLVENVPGLLANGMGDVLGDLAALGYDAEWESIPAAAVGAPHLRRRVFIVAHARCAERWAYCEGHRTDRTDAQGQAPSRTPDAGPHGRAGNVADANGGRLKVSAELNGNAVQDPADWDSSRRYADGRGDKVADPASPRFSILQGGEASADLTRYGAACRTGWWGTEPDVGRVADGVPARVDRLRGLGNAVVPQVAEYIGRRIMLTVAPAVGPAGEHE